MNSEKIVVERQSNTGIWHIAYLERSLKANLEMLLRTGNTNGYVPLGVFDSFIDADLFIDKLKDRLGENRAVIRD